MQTLLLADGYAVIRRGLIASIRDDNTAFEILEASDANSMKQLLKGKAVSHLILSDGVFLESINFVRQHYPGLFVLILSDMPFTLIGETLLEAGTSGYLSKQAAADEITYGINHFLRHGYYVPSPVKRIKDEERGERRAS